MIGWESSEDTDDIDKADAESGKKHRKYPRVKFTMPRQQKSIRSITVIGQQSEFPMKKMNFTSLSNQTPLKTDY